MEKQQSFTIHELEELSGFDRRTIAYYIQAALLPKVGRRGPKTVYPLIFHNKLMLIRTVRDLQDAGRLRAVTLDEIAIVMNALKPGDIRQLIHAKTPDAAIRELFTDPDWDTTNLAVPVEEIMHTDKGRTRKDHTKATAKTRAKTQVHTTDANQPGTLLRELANLCRTAKKAHNKQECTRTTSVQVLPGITLSANNLPPEAEAILQQLALSLSALSKSRGD